MRNHVFTAAVLCVAVSFASVARAQTEAPQNQAPAGEGEQKKDAPGSCLAPLLSAGGVCLGLDAVGLAATGLGCALSQVGPAGGGGNCVEDCVLGIITAGVVVVGIIFAAVGLVVLGPIAAIAVTVAATIASAAAGRSFWAAAVGGAPGILVGLAGVGVAALGLSQMDIGGNGGLQPGLFSGAPQSNVALAGFGITALAGPLALLGALSGDFAFTSMSEEEDEAAPRNVDSRRRASGEVPLAFASVPGGLAY